MKINSHRTKFLKISHKNNYDTSEIEVTEWLLFKIYNDKQIIFVNDATREWIVSPKMVEFLDRKVINLMAVPVLGYQNSVCGVLIFLNKWKPYKVAQLSPKWFSPGDEFIAHLGSYIFATVSH